MKDIIGFKNLYALTEDGEVYSYGNRKGANHDGKFLKPSLDKDGYRKITLRDINNLPKYFRIGRLMLLTFKPTSKNNLQANHIDGNRKNDNIFNLEWVTPSENIKHSFDVLNKNQTDVKNNAFKKWGFEYEGNTTICDDTSVDRWCKNKNVASARVYDSIREKRFISKGALVGYRFFRYCEEFGSTGE